MCVLLSDADNSFVYFLFFFYISFYGVSSLFCCFVSHERGIVVLVESLEAILECFSGWIGFVSFCFVCYELKIVSAVLKQCQYYFIGSCSVFPSQCKVFVIILLFFLPQELPSFCLASPVTLSMFRSCSESVFNELELFSLVSFLFVSVLRAGGVGYASASLFVLKHSVCHR